MTTKGKIIGYAENELFLNSIVLGANRAICMPLLEALKQLENGFLDLIVIKRTKENITLLGKRAYSINRDLIMLEG